MYKIQNCKWFHSNWTIACVECVRMLVSQHLLTNSFQQKPVITHSYRFVISMSSRRAVWFYELVSSSMIVCSIFGAKFTMNNFHKFLAAMNVNDKLMIWAIHLWKRSPRIFHNHQLRAFPFVNHICKWNLMPNT